jgi:hypothetical protein
MDERCRFSHSIIMSSMIEINDLGLSYTCEWISWAFAQILYFLESSREFLIQQPKNPTRQMLAPASWKSFGAWF